MSKYNFDLGKLQNELIRDEGLELESYLDTLGNYTIGVGHLLGPDPKWKGLKWTYPKALEVLDQDIEKAVRCVVQTTSYQSCNTDTRRRALVNMAFQMGSKIHSFKKSMRYIQDQKWKAAAAELRNSLWYTQTPNRAERVVQMILNG